MKELICISSGDSSKISTWSGVPYFHTKALEERGIHIHRGDIGYGDIAAKLYIKTFRRFRHLFNRADALDIYHSVFMYIRLSWTVYKLTRKYRQSDAVLIYSYAPFCHLVTKKPIILFCDWTYDYLLSKRFNRTADFFEKVYVKVENACIHKNSLVFSLFNDCAEYIRCQSRNTNVHCIPGHVINSPLIPSPEIIDKKRSNHRLVFIGRSHYVFGLRLLVNAFLNLKKQLPDLFLDVIGISSEQVPDITDSDVCFHGYLNKGLSEDCELFYNILTNASVIVNPNPSWAGFSSLVEAMFFYTPVVTTRFDAFANQFGDIISFGAYCSQDNLEQTIYNVLSHPEYSQLCMEAHESVKDFTWCSYTDKFLKIVEDTI